MAMGNYGEYINLKTRKQETDGSMPVPTAVPRQAEQDPSQGTPTPPAQQENQPEYAPAPQQAPAPAPAPAATDWSQGAWDANRVRDYFSSRGVTPNATSPDYWAAKWNEWGQKDPAYFLKYLSNAEEFTGGPSQTAQAMWGITPSAAMQAADAQANAYAPTNATTASTSNQYGYAGPVRDAKWDELYKILMDRSQQSLGMTADDPIIKQQQTAFRDEQTRQMRDYLSRVAERSGNAPMDVERRSASEKVGQNTSAMTAQLLQNELTARRTEIQNALTQMGSMLSADQQLQLTRELGLIDANLRQQGITNQNNQFLDSLGLQSTDRASYWDAVRRGLLN